MLLLTLSQQAAPALSAEEVGRLLGRKLQPALAAEVASDAWPCCQGLRRPLCVSAYGQHFMAATSRPTTGFPAAYLKLAA